MPERDRLVEQFLALRDANQAISAATSLEGLGEHVFDAAQRILHHDSVALLLLDSMGAHLELVAFRGEYHGVRSGLRLPVAGPGVTTWVLRTGEPLAVPDISRDERHVASGLPTGSELAVPMKVAGAVTGVLEVQRSTVGPFDDAAPLLLETLANYAAVAVNNLRARADLASEKARLETMFLCSPDAIIATDQRGMITSFSPSAEEMFGFAASEVVGTRVAEYYLGGEREARRVQRHVQDEGRIRNYEAWFKTKSGEPLPTSLSAAALRDREGQQLGTLGILKDITVEKRLERKLSYTIEMLQEANENLGRLALTDNLSGLKNQRYFNRKLEEEILRSMRTKRPVALLLIDIDKFKKFNDNYGHQVGDRVIQEMGVTILQSIRKIDHGCRYGGEEFVVILPETPQESALVVARRIAVTFGTSSVWAELGIEPPTLSIGACATRQDDTETDSDALVKRADDLMYAVKRRGGNDIEAG